MEMRNEVQEGKATKDVFSFAFYFSVLFIKRASSI